MPPAHAPLDFLDIFLRLSLATVCGLVLGFDRELRQKPAGLRTHALVALGSGLATLVGLELAEPGARGFAEASRVIQGIVAGIGFIGGGTILRRGEGPEVHGLTTAATIWVVAALGVASGAGLWEPVLVSLGLTIVLLSLGGRLDGWIERRRIRHDIENSSLELPGRRSPD